MAEMFLIRETCTQEDARRALQSMARVSNQQDHPSLSQGVMAMDWIKMLETVVKGFEALVAAGVFQPTAKIPEPSVT